MNSKTTSTILTFLLGAFVVLDLIFAIQTVIRTREFRGLQYDAAQAQQGLMHAQQLKSVYDDAMAYSQKNPDPDLKRILQPQGKPAK